MRKDVKLGMAIGGGLIAVLVGYLLFAPPTNKKGAQFVNGTPQNIIDSGGGPGDLIPGNAEGSAKATEVTGTPFGTVPDVSGNPKPATTTRPADQAVAKTDDKAKDPVAGKSPKTGDAPKAEKHETSVIADAGGHTANPGAEQTKTPFNPNDAWGGGVSTDAVFGSGRSGKNTPAVLTSGANGPTAAGNGPVAPPTAGGTHVIRSGETFSSIALLAYGSSAYYPHLVRANPTVNPNNLKLGTTIVLPKIEDVKGAAPTAGAAGEHAPAFSPSIRQDVKIDVSRQYRVESGDSLYKIAMKLYGKSSYVDKIYEKNKTVIGPNPTRLKLGMVLELPEKSATVVSAPAADPATSSASETPVEDGQQK